MVRKIWHIVLGIIFSIFILLYFIAWIPLILNTDISSIYLRMFGLGMGIFIVFFMFFKIGISFFSTFEHEFTHMVVGLIFFKKPVQFHVVINPFSESGAVGLTGTNFVVTLSPYFLPTVSFLFIFMYYPFIKEVFYPYFFLILGFLTMYHIISTIREFNYSQPDIVETGYVFSTIVIILGNIVSYGYIYAIVLGGFDMGKEFLLVPFRIIKNVLF